MKKIAALIIASAFILTLAACSSSGKGKSSEKEQSVTAAETTQKAQETTAAETTEAETLVPDTTEADPNMVVIEKEQLIGDWAYPSLEDVVKLTFNANGTGSYTGLNHESLSFTYELTPELKHFNNGSEHINNVLKMSYANGEAEDIIIFNMENGCLGTHNSEDGGYGGILEFSEWKKL